MGWQDAPVVGGGKAAWESAPMVDQESMLDKVKQGAGNLLAGAVRGAGSIGATVLAPYDMAKDALDGKGLSLESNRERRAGMDGGLEALGAQPDSLMYQGGKLAGEVAGTAGAGSALAAGAKVAGAAPAVVDALASGGMSAGGLTGAKELALRAGAGAVTGAASAGMVDPHSAGEGALIGGAIPVLAKGAGALTRAVGRTTAPAQAAQDAAKLEAARKGVEAGYVIPPPDVPGAGVVSKTLSGLSGKIKTSQVASQRNQEVTNAKVRQALGMAADAPITPEALDAIRKEAGQAYGAVAKLGPIDAFGAKLPAGVNVNRVVDPLTLNRRAEVDSAQMVNAWRQANADATSYYRAFARDANPETQAKAKAAAAAAREIDDFMTSSLQKMGRGDLLQALKEARVRIAKTHNAESALFGTGDVSAPKLAAQLSKGKPLSGELRDVAEFSQGFPKATQALKEAPGEVSPLDWLFGVAGSVANPLAGAAVLARPAARAAILSKPAQQRLVAAPGPQSAIARYLSQEGLPAAARSAPVLLSSP